MALLEKSLIVKKSAIPGAGDGLFTKTFIPKGARIVEYTGKTCTWKEVNHDEGRNGYIYYVKRYHVIDARFHEKSMARYANDAQGLTKVKGINNNCEYNIEGLRVFIDAKKDIPAGAEILVDYGREYWSVIRYNNRLSAKEQGPAKEKRPLKKSEAIKNGKAANSKAANGKAANGNAANGNAANGKRTGNLMNSTGKLNGVGKADSLKLNLTKKVHISAKLNGTAKLLGDVTDHGFVKLNGHKKAASKK